MKKSFKIALAGMLGLIAYVPSLALMQFVAKINSSPISSQEQLERKLSEERTKLQDKIGRHTTITAKIGYFGSYSRKIGENNYEIVLSSPATESSLRHELYHIADGHCDKIENSTNLLYFLWAEPQATIYELTGVKP